MAFFSFFQEKYSRHAREAQGSGDVVTINVITNIVPFLPVNLISLEFAFVESIYLNDLLKVFAVRKVMRAKRCLFMVQR